MSSVPTQAQFALGLSATVPSSSGCVSQNAVEHGASHSSTSKSSRNQPGLHQM